MPRDIRATPQFQAVIDYYSALFAPGGDHVYAMRQAQLRGENEVLLIGSTFPGALEEGPQHHAYRLDIAGQRLTLLRKGGQQLALAPDQRHLAVLTGDGIEIVDLENGDTAARLPSFGIVEHLAWSPGGRLGMLVAGAQADVSGAEGGFAMQVDADGPDWLPEIEVGDDGDVWRRVWAWDWRTGDLDALTAPPLNAWEFDWTGDDQIVVAASDHHGEGSWYGVSLQAVDRTGEVRTLHCPQDQLAKPRASPDGAVAFVEAVCSDRGIVCGTLRLLHDGAVRSLATDGVEVTDLHWQGNGRIAIAGQRGLETVIGVYHLDGERFEILWQSVDRTCGDFQPRIAVTPTAIIAAMESFAQAPELVRLDSESADPLHSFAAPGPSPIIGHAEAVSWTAPDGLIIEGLLIRPHADARNLPLLIDIHGGPIWAYRNRWAAHYRAAGPIVARGFAVLLPNPRGSAGRGQDFARLVVGDMGGDDTQDFLSGIDHLAALGVIDPTKVVLTGSSYGGFMSCWLTTQDTRFAASVPISPVVNWYSQHFTSQIPAFDAICLQGSPTDAGGPYFDRSPVFLASRSNTPTLLLTGGRDKNTPPSQALEFHNALRLAGKPSVLCTYAAQGHSLRAFPAYLDSAARVMIWAEGGVETTGPIGKE